jgi:histone deacetylase 1/2
MAKGYHQTLGLDYFETFSPVVKAATIRIILTVAINFQWEIRQLDVHNVFLNGELEEHVYKAQPPGYKDPQFPTKVCRLKKALYGFNGSALPFYNGDLVTLGLTAPCSFILVHPQL